MLRSADRRDQDREAPRRYKRRLKDHHVARANGAAVLDAPSYVIEAPSHEDDDEPTEFNPSSSRKPRQSEAAVGQRSGDGLDMTGRRSCIPPCGHGGNLVYAADGNVGWVDPPTHDPGKHVPHVDRGWGPVDGKDHGPI